MKLIKNLFSILSFLILLLSTLLLLGVCYIKVYEQAPKYTESEYSEEYEHKEAWAMNIGDSEESIRRNRYCWETPRNCILDGKTEKECNFTCPKKGEVFETDEEKLARLQNELIKDQIQINRLSKLIENRKKQLREMNKLNLEDLIKSKDRP